MIIFFICKDLDKYDAFDFVIEFPLKHCMGVFKTLTMMTIFIDSETLQQLIYKREFKVNYKILLSLVRGYESKF